MQSFPTFRPIIPTRVAALFDHPDWIFEMKHDGFRALSHISDGCCDLISRKNNTYKSFGPLRKSADAQWRMVIRCQPSIT
jgi:ATP-dependent DNA ligase